MKDANATNPPENSATVKPSDCSDKAIKIFFDGKTVLYKNKQQTLLECLEEENHEIHYHCRDGFCGACRITLNSGEIDYFNGEPLAYVGKDEILPCCCKPKSDIDITLV